MIEAFVLNVIVNVLGHYIGDLLTSGQRTKRRKELLALVEKMVKENQDVQNRPAMKIAVRELDEIVARDPDLTWQDDVLIIRETERIHKTLPSPREALDELVKSVTVRRRELGLPVAAEDVAPAPARTPVLGDLVPADDAIAPGPRPNLRDEVLGLPTAVRREKDRRRREAGGA